MNIKCIAISSIEHNYSCFPMKLKQRIIRTVMVDFFDLDNHPHGSAAAATAP